nr:ribosomal RNA small subunit methyltransferase I [uncultured bacterium]
MLLDHAMKAGKRISADALEYLLEHVGLNLPSLEQELEKLITYALERSELHLKDVHALCAAQKSSTLWQLAEAIAWKEGFAKAEENIDLSLLLPLISQVRTQLQHGLTLSLLLEKGTPHGEIAHYVPGVKPASLDKMLPVAKVRKSRFFKRALDVLFETELMAKNSACEPALILDAFISKLTLLKRY